MAQVKTKTRRRPKRLTRLGTSFPERAIYHYLKAIFPDTKNGYKFHGQSEIDVYIPSLNLGIEYDGFKYHKRKYKIAIDNRKNIRTGNIGIDLIRVREKGLPELSANCLLIIERESNTSLNDLKECIVLISRHIKQTYKLSSSIIKKIDQLHRISIKDDKQGIIENAFTERLLELNGF
jgi:hypothetical protein